MSGALLSIPANGATNWEDWTTREQQTEKDFKFIDFTNWGSTSIPQIAQGSRVIVNGALYQFTANDTITDLAGVGNGNEVWIKIVPAGATCTAVAVTTDGSTWDADKGGYYDTNDLYVGGLYKDSGGNYINKWLWVGRAAVHSEVFTIDGNSVTLGNDDITINMGPIVKALDGNGLQLQDDGGNLGIYIKDGGNIGIGTTDVESWSTYDVIEFPQSSIIWEPSDNAIFINSNLYYDGSWKYKANGLAAQIYIIDGEIKVRTAVSGTANNVATLAYKFLIDNAADIIKIGGAAGGSDRDCRIEVAGSGDYIGWSESGDNFLITNDFHPTGHKALDSGTAGQAWDDIYADDFNNVADFLHLDNQDDLGAIHAIKGSGVIDDRTGLEMIDDDTIPEWLLLKSKDGSIVLRDPENKPYLSLKTMASLCIGAIRQEDLKLEALKTEVENLKSEMEALKK